MSIAPLHLYANTQYIAHIVINSKGKLRKRKKKSQIKTCI